MMICVQLITGAKPVNVSLPVNISVLQADFECNGNEKFLYNCSNRRLNSYKSETVAGVMCESKACHCVIY